MTRKEVERTFEYIFCSGNTAYLSCHLFFYERKLPREIARFIASDYPEGGGYVFGQCHYFAAWIRFYPELICNKMFGVLSRYRHFKESISDSSFRKAQKAVREITHPISIAKRVEPTEFEEMNRCLSLTIELRHTLQHGGVPNILREMRDPSLSLSDLNKIIDPINYVETKQVFLKADKLISMIPLPIVAIGQGDIVKFKDQN